MKLPAAKYLVQDPKNNHRYEIVLKNGDVIKKLTGVTTILNIIAKPQLINWSARMAAEYFKTELLRRGGAALTAEALEEICAAAKEAHNRIKEAAADVGTDCHDAFEAIIKGEEPKIPSPEVANAIKAFKTYRLQSKIEVVATELAVGSKEHLFGGRIDWIGYDASRGGWGIGDYKTSSGFYGNEYAYQAAGGYAIAVEEQYGVEIKWAEISRFSKKPPFDAEAREVVDVAAAKEGFLLALKLKRNAALKLISETQLFYSAGNVAPAAPAPQKQPAGLGF